MKKALAVVLSLIMTISMVATVSAATVGELTAVVPNPLNLTLNPTVGARLGTSTVAYYQALEISADGATAQVVDYQATLDMEPIRTIFDGEVFGNVLADQDAKTEFDQATVTSTISVAVTYPSSVIVDDATYVSGAANMAGFTAGSIFTETAQRTDADNGNGTKTITVTIGATENAADLVANAETMLQDITFTLPDAISYTALGTYDVTVAITGSTTANFTSGAKTINYTGSATSTVELVQAQSGGTRPSGGSTTSPSVTVPVVGDDHSVEVSATISGSTATIDKIDTDHIDDVARDATSGNTFTIDLSSLSNKVTAVTIPTQTLSAISDALNDADTGATTLSVKLPASEITFDSSATSALVDQADGRNVTIEVKNVTNSALTTAQKNAIKNSRLTALQIVSVIAKSNGVEITDYKGGNVGVSVAFDLPAGYNRNTVVVDHLSDSGVFERMTDALYNHNSGRVMWTTTHMSDYVISAEKEENAFILTIDKKEAMVFGVEKTNDVAPKLVNDRTMLPARFVAENLDATVIWTAEEEDKVLIIKGDIEIIIYIGSDIAYVNGKEVKLDSVAFLENDRTYTPVRFVAESLGANVFWNELDPDTVTITK